MNIKVILKAIIENDGYPVHMDTAFCRVYRKNHPNCIGCESEVGCKKFIDVMIVVTKQIIKDRKKWE